MAIVAGDSLWVFKNEQAIGTSALNPRFISGDGQMEFLYLSNPDHAGIGYFEAQIQETVTLDDVEEIVFHRGAMKNAQTRYPDMQAAEREAMRKSIKVRYDWETS